MSNFHALRQVWHEEEGFLTFEWILLLTLLTIGVVAGLTAARDAIIEELGDVAAAVVSFDQSYSVEAFSEDCDSNTDPVEAPGFSYVDEPTHVERCGRTDSPPNSP